MGIISQNIEIVNSAGLHTRAAVKLAQIARNARSKIWILRNGNKADASSILDILMMACPKGSVIKIAIEQKEDIPVFNNIIQLIENGFGELYESR